MSSSPLSEFEIRMFHAFADEALRTGACTIRNGGGSYRISTFHFGEKINVGIVYACQLNNVPLPKSMYYDSGGALNIGFYEKT